MGGLRKLLYPFAVLYGLVIRLRHFLYDTGILKSTAYHFPVICVGNLSVGGTGKSPMTEYLIRLLQPNYKVGVLSRGYKRKTSGYILANSSSDVWQIGDEPFQYFKKFSHINVAVAEKRTEGISQLMATTATEVIILDDAFQHRKVKAGLQVLLSAYSDLFTDDLLLPAGNLRDIRSRAKAADIIIVTKCPDGIPDATIERLTEKIKSYGNASVFFTGIKYDEVLKGTDTELAINELKDRHFTLVTGIANPAPLTNFLKEKGFTFEHLKFNDHHFFTEKEIDELKKKALVVTTEKDFMRLEKDVPGCFYIGIAPFFINDGGTNFDTEILNYVAKEKAPLKKAP